MAGIALIQRDLADTRARLEAWFSHRFGGEAAVSELKAANRAAGWSSESLVFAADVAGHSSEYVLRIPPGGGGIYPEYDLDAQTRTQELSYLEAVRALGAMGVDRNHVPAHSIGSGRQRPKRNHHRVPADLHRSGFDAMAGGIGDGNAAEHRLQLFGEAERNSLWRDGNDCSRARLGMSKKCMPKSRCIETCDRDASHKKVPGHFLPPKIGLPNECGNMSSM